MDKDTMRRVNAVNADVLSAWRHTMELYANSPELVREAGYDNFIELVASAPRPQIDWDHFTELVLELRKADLSTKQIVEITGASRTSVVAHSHPGGPPPRRPAVEPPAPLPTVEWKQEPPVPISEPSISRGDFKALTQRAVREDGASAFTALTAAVHHLEAFDPEKVLATLDRDTFESYQSLLESAIQILNKWSRPMSALVSVK